jgi:hypothetical protein
MSSSSQNLFTALRPASPRALELIAVDTPSTAG